MFSHTSSGQCAKMLSVCLNLIMETQVMAKSSSESSNWVVNETESRREGIVAHTEGTSHSFILLPLNSTEKLKSVEAVLSSECKDIAEIRASNCSLQPQEQATVPKRLLEMMDFSQSKAGYCDIRYV
ncbi:hypothetical protein Q9966_014214 [Columba livia]|nr:hypothetical protein Q9966_014214 [Columba livia]